MSYINDRRKAGKKINVSKIPEGYIKIVSGLGAAPPSHLAIIPIFDGNEVSYIVEIASFKKISEEEEKLILKSLTPEKRRITRVAAQKRIEKEQSENHT